MGIEMAKIKAIPEAHGKEIVNRFVQAYEDFLDTLQNCGDVSREDAVKVFAVYKDNKVIKLDTWMGRYSVKHGAFLDKDVIANAVNIANEAA
jgi:hypothetical protein